MWSTNSFMARLVTSARYRSPKKGYIHLSRAYRRVSIVVCSSGLRLRLERDCSQISPCSLKVMLEGLSRNVCVELMPSSSSFSAAFRSAIVRVRHTPNDTKPRLGVCRTRTIAERKAAEKLEEIGRAHV